MADCVLDENIILVCLQIDLLNYNFQIVWLHLHISVILHNLKWFLSSKSVVLVYKYNWTHDITWS